VAEKKEYYHFVSIALAQNSRVRNIPGRLELRGGGGKNFLPAQEKGMRFLKKNKFFFLNTPCVFSGFTIHFFQHQHFFNARF